MLFIMYLYVWYVIADTCGLCFPSPHWYTSLDSMTGVQHRCTLEMPGILTHVNIELPRLTRLDALLLWYTLFAIISSTSVTTGSMSVGIHNMVHYLMFIQQGRNLFQQSLDNISPRRCTQIPRTPLLAWFNEKLGHRQWIKIMISGWL